MCNEYKKDGFDINDPFAGLEDWDNEKDAPAPADDEATKAVKEISGGHTESVKAEPGKYPCKACGGKGTRTKYIRGGGWGQSGTPYTCPACKGKGMLKTSPEQRAKAKAARAERKARLAEERRQEKLNEAADYRAANADIAEWLAAGVAKGNDFATSLNNGLDAYGHLTDGQANAVRNAIVRDAKREAEQAAAPVVELAGLVKFMHNAKASGLKFPKLRLQTEGGQKVVLSVAGARAKRPNTINITDGGPFGDNIFFGRISTEGKLEATRACNDDVTALLVEMNDADGETIKVQGRRTGNCMCCGRELTKGESVERGIGPVCASKWGM